MIPVVTPDEMSAIDAAAPEPVEVLIERAGAAVARGAVELVGRSYGVRAVVVAGKGNNGRDGLAAARRLRRRGWAVTAVAAGSLDRIEGVDLVLDAAFGTSFRGEYHAPDVGRARVLAVDLPSGVDAATGCERGRALRADRTVTFAALKPGLVLGRGALLAGEVTVADIGLDTRSATVFALDDRDIVIPLRARDAHKYAAGVWIVGGSPNMAGAPVLAARGAFAAGASYVRVSTPGVDVPEGLPVEAVGYGLGESWADRVVEHCAPMRSVVLGPGLGRSSDTLRGVRTLFDRCPLPMVVDGDALHAVADTTAPAGSGVEGAGGAVRRIRVLTPHDGEYRALMGGVPGDDRIEAARAAARRYDAVVLLKGPTTVVAGPDGAVRLVTAGDARLATAGTGDVLSGVVGAYLAAGVGALDAAALAAQVHAGAAVRFGRSVGMTASDLPGAIGRLLSSRVGPLVGDVVHSSNPVAGSGRLPTAGIACR
ncbi:MAG: NAD(P)H-hydrate dehydratase [Microthrixaceae bacterium]